jgi:hypothetical protein
MTNRQYQEELTNKYKSAYITKQIDQIFEFSNPNKEITKNDEQNILNQVTQNSEYQIPHKYRFSIIIRKMLQSLISSIALLAILGFGYSVIYKNITRSELMNNTQLIEFIARWSFSALIAVFVYFIIDLRSAYNNQLKRNMAIDIQNNQNDRKAAINTGILTLAINIFASPTIPWFIFPAIGTFSVYLYNHLKTKAFAKELIKKK